MAERLELLDLPAEGGAHRHHVVELAGAERDGRATQFAGAALGGQDLLPLLRHLALRPEQMQEDLVGGAGQPLAAVLQPEALRPRLQHLGILGQLADDAVRLARPQSQAAPLAEAAHGHPAAVPHGQQRAPRRPQVPRPEVTCAELAVPLSPCAELGHRGLPPLRPEAGPQALRVVALEDAASVLVEEGVPLPGREGHGARLLHGRLVRVQELPLAVHEEHRRAPPDAELADLLGRDAPLLPAAVADGVEVGEHLLQRQPQQLRQLPGRAELVVPLLEGRGQDLVALEELVRDLAQGTERLPQARFHQRAVVDVLRGLRAQRPLPRPVEVVDLLRELHDHVVLRGVAQP